MKYIANKKIVSGLVGITLFLAGFWLVSPYIKEASADAWLAADAHVIDGYINGCWNCKAPKAPMSMQIFLHGGGNFDGGTNFQWDCDNDGVYEGSGSGTKPIIFDLGDGIKMFEWYNGVSLSRHSWDTYRGTANQYWYELKINCFYQTGGDKKVNVKAERGGMTATGSTSFNIQDLTFGFSIGIPNNGDYQSPFGGPSNNPNRGTAAPSNIDVGIGMRENDCVNCYQDTENFQGFDKRSFTYEVDCNGDGVYNERSGSSNNSTFSIYHSNKPKWTQATFADNVCNFQKAGYYRIGFKIKDPTGKEHIMSQDVYLRSNKPFAVSVWPTGESPNSTSYSFSGSQQVKMSLNVAGLMPLNTGSYSTSIDCGNGQTISGPSANGRDYPEGALGADNLGPCNYSQPGVYTVVAKFQEYKPSSETFPAKSGEGKAKIIITGESAGAWTVVSPFSLEWDVSKADSCSITGLNNSFSATGLSASGSKAVPKVSAVGSYDYKISCVGTGGTTEQNIKLNVVEILQ